jgi:hypothetical protein
LTFRNEQYSNTLVRWIVLTLENDKEKSRIAPGALRRAGVFLSYAPALPHVAAKGAIGVPWEGCERRMALVTLKSQGDTIGVQRYTVEIEPYRTATCHLQLAIGSILLNSVELY